MPTWSDRNHEYEYDIPQPEVAVTANPVTGVILDHAGTVLIKVHERPTRVGFR